MIFAAGVAGIGAFSAGFLGFMALLAILVGAYVFCVWLSWKLTASAGIEFKSLGIGWWKAYIPFYNVYLLLRHRGESRLFWLWFAAVAACTLYIVLGVASGITFDDDITLKNAGLLISSCVLFYGTAAFSWHIRSITPYLSWGESVLLLLLIERLF